MHLTMHCQKTLMNKEKSPVKHVLTGFGGGVGGVRAGVEI